MALISELEHGDKIKDALKAHVARLAKYEKYWNYYNGEHRMNYVSSAFRKKYGAVFAEFADNVCRRVVDIPKARTLLERINSDQDKTDEFFRDQRIDGVQRCIHRDAYLFGDAYVVLWNKGDGDRLYPNAPFLMVPVYDESEPGRMLCAVKVWVVGEGNKRRVRLTFYYPDRVMRYVTSGYSLEAIVRKNLAEFSDDGEDHQQDHDYGIVPVFHFANKAGPGEMGISELVDAIPLQDALNKTVFDLLVNNEHISLAQRWATGIDVEIDPNTGEKKNPFDGKQLWITGNDQAKFGQLEAGNSEQILKVVNDFRKEISIVTGIPAYYFQSDTTVPSGVALKVIEAPLRDKVEEAQVLFGNVWEDLFAVSLGLEVAEVSAGWRDTSPVSEGEILDNGIKKKALGYSRKQIFREIGKSDEDIDQILDERAEEDDAEVQRQQSLITRGGEL